MNTLNKPRNRRTSDGKDMGAAPVRYSSDAMEARRARILEAARTLLVRDGGTFTMRDLAGESGVALATLYNIFGSQDDLIAQAVAEIFVERIQNLALKDTTSPITMMLERLELAHNEILRVPAYAKRMLTIYFDSQTDSAIRDMLHTYPFRQNKEVLEALNEQNGLQDWVVIEVLANDLTVAQYGVITHWAAGGISDDVLKYRQHYASLSILAGALKGKWANDARERLRALSRHLREGTE